MRIARYRFAGATHIGVVEENGVVPVRLRDAEPNAVGPRAGAVSALLAAIAGRDLERDAKAPIPHDDPDLHLLAPVLPGKIVAIGKNYRDHAVETGADVPLAPLLFAKFPSAVTGPHDPIEKPPSTEQLDYEAELGVVIGRRARRVTERDALDHVAGYLAVNDVTARDVQYGDGQWVRGKSFDTFAPMGPVLVSADEVGAPTDLRVVCRVNGEIRQADTTASLIFSVAEIISYCSQFFTLEPGDVISTGTPAGCGAFMDPPRYLQPGDVVEVEIEGIGVLRNPVVAVP